MSSLRFVLPICFSLLLQRATVLAQWQDANGHDGRIVHSFAFSPAVDAADSTSLFAGTFGGVFISTDNGVLWTAADSGLTNTDVRSLAVSPAGDGAGGANIFSPTHG